MTPSMGQCDVCLNRYNNLKGYRCEAYPDGIPEMIHMGSLSHVTNVDGDHGVKFEQDPSKPKLKDL
jgi:hypothetical protein